MKNIAIHYTYGGFKLPDAVKEELYLRGVELSDDKYPDYDCLPRDHPVLIEVLCDMAEIAVEAEIVVLEIPGDIEWVIQDYDGMEWVAEKHRTWNLGDTFGRFKEFFSGN